MEIKLDVGKNTFEDLTKYAQKENKAIDHFAVDMIDLGLGVYKGSAEKLPEIDEKERLLLENNALIKKIIRCVFEKTKISQKVFDVETLITLIENNTESFLQEKINNK